jgi:hypothetical protein
MAALTERLRGVRQSALGFTTYRRCLTGHTGTGRGPGEYRHSWLSRLPRQAGLEAEFFQMAV